MRRSSDNLEPEPHGSDTLRTWRGTVVGVHGDDVFVELGPRMQGVISAREFDERPAEGDSFDFTLGGQEAGLWALSRRETRALATWENLEVESLVQARVTGKNHGGLELKIGPLHAFMPRSEVGVPREQKIDGFVGRTMTCEVIQIDHERQRVVVSRKVVVNRERDSQVQRLVTALRPGQVVQGRVTRVEPYGAFVGFGHGLQGLIHVRDLSLERVDHPSDVVKKGDHLTVKVLHVKGGGKRIGLGLKQMEPSPWANLERYVRVGRIVAGTVVHLAGYGAFVEIEKGVEGLLHVSQTGVDDVRRLREVVPVGQRLSVRVLSMDTQRERLSLSLLHEGGRRIDPEEALQVGWFEALQEQDAEAGAEQDPESEGGALGTNLGRLVRDALQRESGAAAANPESEEGQGTPGGA